MKPFSSHHYYSTDRLNTNCPYSFTTPIYIQSKNTDGHIFNLIQIVEDIGYNEKTPFIRESPNPDTKHVSALLNIILKNGGAHGPLSNAWRSRINNNYFQRWYLEKHYQNSSSLNQHNIMNTRHETTTRNTSNHDHQSNMTINNLVPTELREHINNEEHYYNQIQSIYGCDEMDTNSTLSSHSSHNERESKNNSYSTDQQLPSILKKSIDQHTQTDHHMTIREHSPINNTNQSTSSKQINDNDDKCIFDDYRQVISSHSDIYRDPQTEIIKKPNPDQLTYQQNISVRYLVPPTPPPPGPLIIRGNYYSHTNENK